MTDSSAPEDEVSDNVPEPDTEPEARHTPVLEYPVYKVLEDVEVSFSDRDGSEIRYAFTAGTTTPDSEDAWYVLEHNLVPSGLAEKQEK